MFPSVPGQVVIAGGTFEALAGSSVSVPVEFNSAGGTLELFSTTRPSMAAARAAR